MSMQLLHIISISLWAISAIIITVIGLVLVWQCIKWYKSTPFYENTDIHQKRNIYLYVIFCIICFDITSIVKVVELYRLFETITSQEQILYQDISTMSWAIAQLFVYMLLTTRLKQTFKFTTYAIKKCTLIAIYIQIALFEGSYIGLFTSVQLYMSNLIAHEIYLHCLVVFNWTAQIIDILLSICLIYLFINKLFAVIIDSNREQLHEIAESRFNSPAQSMVSGKSFGSASYELHSPELIQRQMTLLRVINKFCLIAVIILLGTQIQMIGFISTDVVWYILRDAVLYEHMWWIAMCIWPVQCVIVSLCMYLNLDIGKQCYRILCRKSERCCIKCCIKITQHKMNKIVKELEVGLLEDEYGNN
eukprot:371421_1